MIKIDNYYISFLPPGTVIRIIRKKVLQSTGPLLFASLISILALSFLMFTFVFIINWEDYFFSIRLAGPLAGTWLFAKAALAFIIMYLLVQFPRHRTAGTIAATGYFGLLFFSTWVTIRNTSGDSQAFPYVFAVLLAIPVLLLIVTLVAERHGYRGAEWIRETDDKHTLTMADGAKSQALNPLILLLGTLVILMILGIIIIPLGIAMLITQVPFLHQMTIPPAYDTVLIKVDKDGNRVWTTIIPGHSLDFVQVVESDGGSCLLYGIYWMPQQTEAQIRVVKFDRAGNRMWDMRRSMRFGTGSTDTAGIMGVDPENSGAVIWLTNGMSLHLDGEGTIIAETPSTDYLPPRTTEFLMPPRYSVTGLPASAAEVLIVPEGRKELLVIFEDTITHKEIQRIYSVSPASEGGFILSGSVKP
jgi:hypothetical protein